jgi:tetratricopeptide (TPR) repeat protein
LVLGAYLPKIKETGKSASFRRFSSSCSSGFGTIQGGNVRINVFFSVQAFRLLSCVLAVSQLASCASSRGSGFFRSTSEISSEKMKLSNQDRLARHLIEPDVKALSTIQESFQSRKPGVLDLEVKRMQKTMASSLLIPNALYRRGLLYFEMSQLDLAKAQFTEILRQFPDSERAAPTLYALGYVYQAQGNYPMAVKAYSKVRQNYPGSVEAFRAKFQLDIVGHGFHDEGVKR